MSGTPKESTELYMRKRICPNPTLAYKLPNSTLTTPPPQSSSTTTRYCDSFPHARPRSLCIGLQRMHRHYSRPLPPHLDPRFGAEKRRVPTGPNPLHN
ncbi:unnamed protein product [Sphenostylis stenocarpa]|uniref:Uncharacterized protein n=1 Tax=Sphenostylis stenocarpa TaxID=92480 RepID=A0AA86SH52_9FABA|nr:unnamed protein product [Sphenostylis stenocarpa]